MTFSIYVLRVKSTRTFGAHMGPVSLWGGWPSYSPVPGVSNVSVI